MLQTTTNTLVYIANIPQLAQHNVAHSTREENKKNVFIYSKQTKILKVA